ncbi:hypothetical protein [Pseudoglutamicibacter cumminsii]|uniref:hypothetical protein n=1 Tax=Pseudoglutamicibacter cumminsii TaxID=156979 RepID=UPI0035C7F5EA
MRKLELIHAARDLDDLRIPPGNRLERLVVNWRGQRHRLPRRFPSRPARSV